MSIFLVYLQIAYRAANANKFRENRVIIFDVFRIRTETNDVFVGSTIGFFFIQYVRRFSEPRGQILACGFTRQIPVYHSSQYAKTNLYCKGREWIERKLKQDNSGYIVLNFTDKAILLIVLGVFANKTSAFLCVMYDESGVFFSIRTTIVCSVISTKRSFKKATGRHTIQYMNM